MSFKPSLGAGALLACASLMSALGFAEAAFARETNEAPRREDRREDRARETDDRGTAKRGADDGPNHDVGDDRGGGNDDGPNHDANDDHGRHGGGNDDPGRGRGRGRSGRDDG